jgi:hypothetical protein
MAHNSHRFAYATLWLSHTLGVAFHLTGHESEMLRLLTEVVILAVYFKLARTP